MYAPVVIVTGPAPAIPFDRTPFAPTSVWSMVRVAPLATKTLPVIDWPAPSERLFVPPLKSIASAVPPPLIAPRFSTVMYEPETPAPPAPSAAPDPPAPPAPPLIESPSWLVIVDCVAPLPDISTPTPPAPPTPPTTPVPPAPPAPPVTVELVLSALL